MKPTAFIPRYNLAQTLEDQGRVDEAIEVLKTAVRLSPDPLARMRLALLLDGEGLEEEAIGHLRELIRESPQQAAAYNNLAALLARRGELEQARQLLETALGIDPFYADARLNLLSLSEYSRTSGSAGAPPDVMPTGLSGDTAGGRPAP